MKALLLLLAFLQTPEPSASIAGTVVTAGTVVERPLQNARLELNGPGGARIVRSDSNGRFAFTNLIAGQYRLSVTRDGFIRQEYGQRSTGVRGAAIVVSEGQRVPDIAFRMEPASTVAGGINDDFGEPIANIIVQALRRSYDIRGNPTFTEVASALTNDHGEYRLFWLDPGSYYFYVTNASQPAQLAQTGGPESTEPGPNAVGPTYFPGVGAPGDAQSIRVPLGREVGGVNFRLRRTTLVNVFGFTSSRRTGGIPASVTLFPPTTDPNQAKYKTQSSEEGSFGFIGVAPGVYIASGKAALETPMFGVARVTIPPITYVPPPLKRPEFDVRIELSPGTNIDGRLYIDAGSLPDLRPARVTLTSVDSVFPSPVAVPPGVNGQFSIPAVPSGTYLLAVSDLPEDLYLKAARLGEVDVLENAVKIEKESALSLQTLLGSDGGHITTTVLDADDVPFEGAQVVLVPDAARRKRPDQYRIGVSGDDGSITIRGVPPGDYTLFAWEAVEPNAYLNADYLRDYEGDGATVRIRPGDNVPVSVHSLPAR